MSWALRTAWRWLPRDWQRRDLRLIALALIIAVAAVTAVGFFTDRINRAMTAQANELLGADLVLSTAEPIRPTLLQTIQDSEVKTNQTLAFSSVVLANQQTLLVRVKAVTPGYPLRGELSVAAALDRPDKTTREVPAAGEIWVAPRVLTRLDLKVSDHLTLGEKTFRIGRLITQEPAGSGISLGLAPRILMRQADLEATGLLTPVSRVDYRLAMIGESTAITRLSKRLRPQLQPGENLVDRSSNRPALGAALERAERFLGLAALSAVLLAGAAVALLANRFASSQADTMALLRCLGASRRQVLLVYLLRLGWLGLLAGLVGVVLGWLAQFGLGLVLADWLQLTLPLASIIPAFTGLATAALALAGFALPPLLQQRNIPPLRVLRRELGPPNMAAGLVLISALLALSLLLFWQAGDAVLAAWILGGSAGLIAVLWGLTWLLVLAVGQLRAGHVSGWRFGLMALARQRQLTHLQVVAFGIGIMAILLLAVVRVDLLAAWQTSLPPGTPNHYLINIQSDERAALRSLLAEHGIAERPFSPMIRGRLLAKNGQPLRPNDVPPGRPRRLLEREFNLSYASKPQASNRVIAGQFWGPEPANAQQFSVSQNIAESFGIVLGDTLTFRVAGQQVTATVTSLRKVNWDSFNVNFFVVAPPALLAEYPQNWITSIHIPAEQASLLRALADQFPAVTIIDVRAILAQVRRILAQASLAVEYVFLFTLAAGLVILLAASQATRERRLQEAALMRVLGAQRRLLHSAWASESATLGALAGLLGSGTALIIGWGLAMYVLDIPYQPNLALHGLGWLGATLFIGLAGMLTSRGLLRPFTWEILRQQE